MPTNTSEEYLGSPAASLPLRRTRNFHRRSRNGCIPCKQRHVRCDESLPYCKKCLSYGRNCAYPPPAESQRDRITRLESFQKSAQNSSVQKVPCILKQVLSQDLSFSGSAFNLDPLSKALDCEESFMVVKYQEGVTKMRIMQQNIEKVINGIVSTYLRLASENTLNKHSVLSLAGTFYHRSNPDRKTLAFALYHRHFSLRSLQNAIIEFSPQNTDSILAASMNLSNQATNWEEWLCFTTGIANVLQIIKRDNLPTSFEVHTRNPFVIRQYEAMTTLIIKPLSTCLLQGQTRVASIISSLQELKASLLHNSYSTLGFSDLEHVCFETQKAFHACTAEEIFRKTDLLRMWIYYLPCGPTLTHAYYNWTLRAYFFALVLAATPLFPEQLHQLMVNICTDSLNECWSQGSGLQLQPICELPVSLGSVSSINIVKPPDSIIVE